MASQQHDEDLRRRLQMLEEDYRGQPPVVQEADLPEINRVRAELGLPQVDARLKEVASAAQPTPTAAATAATATATGKPSRDHSEARAIYERYLTRVEELEANRAYAKRVAKATSGAGMTPVYPLATMGTNGGALLCDYCEKPIVLEGGSFHGMNADAAWAAHSNPTESWTSWMLGGLVVEIAVNGTLRIYHGYLGANNSQCCNAVNKREKKRREEYEASKTSAPREKIVAFFEDELPELKTKNERYELYSKIVDVLYSWDPGFGLNRPTLTPKP